MPRPEREERMLEVAYRAFARKGFAGVSMEELAGGAGVTKPLLYAYHGSKEELFATCQLRMAATMIAGVDAAVDRTLPADQQLHAGIRAQLGFIEEHPDEWRCFYRDAFAQGGPGAATVGEARRRVTALLESLMADILAARGFPPAVVAEAAVFAHALQGAVEATASWWLEHPDESRDAVALRLMNLAWGGFRSLLELQLWSPPSAPS